MKKQKNERKTGNDGSYEITRWMISTVLLFQVTLIRIIIIMRFFPFSVSFNDENVTFIFKWKWVKRTEKQSYILQECTGSTVVIHKKK